MEGAEFVNRGNAEKIQVAHTASQQLFRDAILYLLQRAELHGDNGALELAEEMLGAAGPQDITSVTFLRYLQRSGMHTGSSRSFRARIVETYDKHQLGVRDPSWFLDDKMTGYRFADTLGIRRPESSQTLVPWSEVEVKSGTVIKVANDSAARGCYLVHSPDNIWSVQEGRRISSIEELREQVSEFLAQSDRGSDGDRWIVEPLLMLDQDNGETARDVKLFCFYGNVTLIREIERVPVSRTVHWDENGVEVHPLLKRENSLRVKDFPSEALEMGRRISLEIPAPFVRIDLMLSEDGLYLGEFTPWPGTFARKTPEWDQRLGDEWVKAEARLQDDLIGGKSFATFDEATGFTAGNKINFPT